MTNKPFIASDCGYVPHVGRLLWELGHYDEIDKEGFSIARPTIQEACARDGGSERITDATASYQRFRPWLKVDGDFGPVTRQAAIQESGCRCGCPDIMQRGAAGLAEWPPTCQDVTTGYSLDSLRTSLDAGKTVHDAWLYGIERWNLVCGIVLSVVGYGDDPRIKAKAGRMGGGTLAWSYLANGSCDSVLDQEYNQAVTWNWLTLWQTICHEVGHALGLPHTGQAGNVMTPYHSNDVTALGPWDIAQVVKRYGKPPDVPDVPPVPGVVGGGILELVDPEGFPIGTFDVFPRATTDSGG